MRLGWIAGPALALLLAAGVHSASATSIVAPHCLPRDARLQLPLAELSRRVRLGEGMEVQCAAKAMLDWHPAQAMAALTKLFRHGAPDTRVQIITALGYGATPEERQAVLPLLLQALRDRNADVRAAAFGALAGVDAYPREAVAAALYALQRGKTPDFVAGDYLAYASSLPSWAVEPLVGLLERNARQAGDAQLDAKVQLLQALGRTHDPRALAVVADAVLTCGDYCDRQALDALAESGDGAVAPLVRIFSRADVPARIDIALALDRIGTPRARKALAQCQSQILRGIDAQLASASAMEQSDGLVRLANMQRLAQPALPRIVAFLDNADPQLRAEAADALRAIDLAAAIPPLRRHQDDPNAWVKQEIGIALAQLEWSTAASH